MTHSEKINREAKSLSERGLHDHAFFSAHFDDGSSRTEHDTNWSEMAEKKDVKDPRGQTHRSVMLAKVPLKSLKISYNGFEKELTVGDGEELFQANIGELYWSNNTTINRLIGKRIGKVKNGKIIEEHIISRDGVLRTI